MTAPTPVGTRFDVGGVLLRQPFKIRRLGHFGLNVVNMEEGLRFYTDLLGFRISDTIDFSERARNTGEIAAFGDPKGYFMRYGSDHHAFVLFNKRVREALDTQRRFKPGVTINQITWQVGSLREVADAIDWFNETGVQIQRVGRDMPGSNWHAYLYDPDGHTNELYYGIEQIGWNGYCKPPAMYSRGFHEAPPLPQIAEQEEVQQALANGVDLLSGSRYVDPVPATYDVDGILLPRPFKVVRIGPLRLFVQDLDVAVAFYTQTLGFQITEEVVWRGHRCVFLRANTEHHSVALYPIALREVLGLSGHTTCLAFGLQVANYRQLRNAVRFLQEAGVTVVQIPPELHPGIEYAAHVLDPDGHAMELYYSMEQVGWDGQPRPRDLPQTAPSAEWPEVVEGGTDVYTGEPFLGPWA